MSSRRTPALHLLLLLIFPLFVAPLAAQDSATLLDRLHHAETETSIDLSDGKPWHMVLDFELFNREGYPSQKGQIEEWWASPNQHKIVYTHGPSTWIEISGAQGVYQTVGAEELPALSNLLREQSIHPLFDYNWSDAMTARLEKKQIGEVSLDCIRIAKAPMPASKPDFSKTGPMVCLDQDKSTLRVTTMNTEAVVRGTLGTFAGKSVPTDLNITFDGFLAGKSHIAALQTVSFSAADFTPDTTMTRTGDAPIRLQSRVIAPHLKSHVTPIFPDSAKRDHVSGTVILHVFIAKDGHVRSAKTIYAPRQDLADSAIKSVSQWVYQPYLLNGYPVDVDTQITVNFSF